MSLAIPNDTPELPPRPLTNQTSIINDEINNFDLSYIYNFAKTTAISLINKFMSSNYINSVNDGKIHLYSFGLGVIMTMLVIMVQPLLMVYLDTWIVFLSKLFKHLLAWVVVGVFVSYILNPKKKLSSSFQKSNNSMVPSTSTNPDGLKINTYTVVPQIKAATTLPERPPISSNIRPTSQPKLAFHEPLQKLNEQEQAIAKAKRDVESSRPSSAFRNPSNYDIYMENALNLEKERQNYNNFVNNQIRLKNGLQ